MRIVTSASVLIIASAMALPSAACDRHGGMFGQLGGASWTDYNPVTAESDALFLDEKLSEWHKLNAVPPAEVKPVKPTFSKASSRASIAAKTRLAKTNFAKRALQTKLAKIKADQKASNASVQVSTSR